MFEGHRINDFQQELQRRSTARKGGFFHTVATTIRNFFSGDEKNTKPKRKRKILENFAPGIPDIASVAVIATNCSACQKAHSMLQKAVKDACKDTDVDIEVIPEGFDTNELKTIAAKFGVSLKFQVKPDREGKGKVTLQGFKEDVFEVKSTVLMLLNKALVDETDAANKERILERGRWLWEEDDGTFKPYSDEQTVRIETARERGEYIVKISFNGVDYDVDIAKQIQTAPGRRARKIRRENKFQQVESTPLPANWTNPGSGQQDYELYNHSLQKRDSEYRRVYKAFTSTGGPTSVVSIERVQNPKIYRRYTYRKKNT